MSDPSLTNLHRLVWTAIMAALTAVGAYIQFPLGPVPFSMQTFFILLAGLILGPAYGALSMLLYLGAGLIGLPVFAKGASGFAQFMGPTGGFLFGFILLAAGTGLATGGKPRPGGLSWVRGVAFCLLGTVLLYVLGIWRLKAVIGSDWTKALSVGLVPFIPGLVLKIAGAVACYRYLARRRLLPS